MEKLTDKDFDRIISEAVQEYHSSGKTAYPHPFFGDRISSEEYYTSFILRQILRKSMESIAEESEQDTLAAEKIVVALHKQGVPKENVLYKHNCFQAKLTNCCFRIYRSDDCRIRLWQLPVSGKIGSNLHGYLNDCSVTASASPEKTAELLLAIDSMMPRIKEALLGVSEKVQAQKIQEEKDKRIRKIQDETIRSLIREYLSEPGMKVNFTVGGTEENPVVELEISQTKAVTLTVPMEKLPETLSDTGSIKESMTPVTVEDFQTSLRRYPSIARFLTTI